MNKRKIFLLTPWFMGVLFIVFAMAMAFATFYENDFGAVAAKLLVYDTWWFELIFLLMIVNLVGQVFQYKLYKRSKLTILLFHVAFIFMIIGAGVTRYFGFEGIVHIREGEVQNKCKSLDKYLIINIKDVNGEKLFTDSKKIINTPIKKERYKKKVKVDNIDYSLRYTKFLPNATETIVNAADGEPMISLLVSKGMMGRQNLILEEGEVKNLGGVTIGFNRSDSVDINILLNESFTIQSVYPISKTDMKSQGTDEYELNEEISFEKMMIFKIKGLTIIPDMLSKSGSVEAISLDSKSYQTNASVMLFELAFQNKVEKLLLWTGQNRDNSVEFVNGDHIIELNYNSLIVDLSYGLKLEDFILERYPGSTSPSSFKSNVVLIDKKDNVNKPYSIYMNHILKYKGWRFYQSSYDKDEMGTILSVNKDFWGMIITYMGYFMLFLFIILSMLNKKSAFRSVTKNFFKSSATKSVMLILFLFTSVFTARSQDQKLIVEKSRADKFGEVLVQNQKGRTEPLYTLSNDILRKVSRETEIEGYTPMQVFLGLYFDFDNWQKVSLIKISNDEVKKLVGISGDYAAFTDIVDLKTNNYKIKPSLDAAYAKKPGERSKFDKELIKVDERLNICFMIYSGEFMKIFPVKDKFQKWKAPNEAYKFASNSEDSLYLKNIVKLFAQGIESGNVNGDYLQSDEVLKSILIYQRNFAQYILPSDFKVKSEIFYYKSKMYDRLFPYYATIGLILLFILLYGIIAQRKEQKLTVPIFTGLLIIGFVFHTLGLAIRWYVSGHAPMSNGYESMIFISWVTILAGFLFSKRSAFVLAATSVLGGFTLMVAHLSFMDPEITNLVPVLQSYWLTLHVSVITGSYGFLGLGAIIGLIVLILYISVSQKNKNQINTTVEELTVISFKVLTIGLYLLTIGTFLGAIWANESWGRYWGWDPKETWSLITIIVYSFVLHARMIDGLKGFFAFNVMALFAFSSVLMTYFGVNYYLSGLHSYAGGDPVPVPKFVYVSVVLLVSTAILAYWKYKKDQMD
ncbi:MAG: c-type cytochrome biogenesis protein CcsB [Bacteroidales bacterium]|nr:c-type cytochrome biogenesis protein CcsB [Bacteroidales bacterium]